MMDVKVFGVGHIDAESRRVADEIIGTIDDKTLVFLEPTEDMIRSPDKIVIYQRGFWTSMRDVALAKGAKIVPISHETFPRRDNGYGKYLGLPTGIPEPRLGVAILLEEQLQADWIARYVSEGSYNGVVIIGDAHGERINKGLSERGLESHYISLYDFEPTQRLYKEITNLVEQEGNAKCVRIFWVDRVIKDIIDKTFEVYRRTGLREEDFGADFNLVTRNEIWTEEFKKAKKELLENGRLEPSKDEQLYQGCTNPMSLSTHKMMIEIMHINPLRDYIPPILTKKDFAIQKA